MLIQFDIKIKRCQVISVPVIFNEKNHTYCNDITGEPYLGASAFLSTFEEPFDKTGQILIGKARSVSIERGIRITPKMLQQEWTNKGDYSRNLGTKLHYALEQMILGIDIVDLVSTFSKEEKPIFVFDEAETRETNKIQNVFKKEFAKIKGVLVPEERLYNDDLEMAGTSDLVWYHNNNQVSIGDFKFTESIDKFSKHNNFLLDPVSHLQHSNWTHYNLQLSLYAYFLEKRGYKVKDLFLYHIKLDKIQEKTKTGETITTGWTFNKVEKIYCQYLKSDIENMIKYWILKKNLL